MAARRKIRFALGLWAFLLCVLGSARGDAQPAQASAQRGIAANGLCGLIYAEFPTCPVNRAGFAASAGYGYTESQGPVPGAHHRLAGTLGAALVPLDWLALSLRLDGRFDMHPDDAQGRDTTVVGEPRLAARAGWDVGRDISVGGALGLWFPGKDAPSFDLQAATVDFKALTAWTPRESRWSALGTLGFRLDNSANSAPDLTRIRPGDRLSLGLSDSNALLLAVGTAYRIGQQMEAFADLSADLLVGAQAPAISASPMRVSVGGRYFLSRTLQAEASLVTSLSSRPKQGPSDPLVPIEPRLQLNAGIRFGIPTHVASPPEHEPEPTPPAPVAEPPTAPAPAVATLSGTFTDEQGQPIPEVTVLLKVGDVQREAITNSEGRYMFVDAPVGTVHIEAAATGFTSIGFDVELVPDMAPQAAQVLVAHANTGTLRCLTRSFRSEPLRAQLSIRDERGREVAKGESDPQGLFEIALPPGSYQVIIVAPGYRTHRAQVKVSSNGVAILNLDMHEK